VNSAQLTESIKLRDLLATQAQAESVYMAGQTEKSNSKDTDHQAYLQAAKDSAANAPKAVNTTDMPTNYDWGILYQKK